MGVLTKTFRDFFEGRFEKDRAYLKFAPDHFQSLFEMAAPAAGDFGDVPRLPVYLDKEDHEFLSQFPAHYWPAAQQQRYDMLHDALHKLHDERMGMGFDDLKQAIKTAMTSGDWSEVARWQSPQGEPMDQAYLAKIKQESNPEAVRGLNAIQLDDEADKHAYEYIKAKTERIPSDNAEVDFKFPAFDMDDSGRVKGSGASSKTLTIAAKPFLNRLYHKLERTQGQEHDPTSGMEGKGQYGYDLARPASRVKTSDDVEEGDDDEDDPTDGVIKFTRGMKFPNKINTGRVMKDFMNMNMHQIYGNYDNLPPGARWMQVYSDDGKKPLVDKWTYQETYDKYLRHFAKQIKTSDKKFGTQKEMSAEVRRLAKDAVTKLIREGKLKSPPIPGVAPDGIPLTISDKGVVKHPPLYLPHVKKTVRVNGQPKEIWTPITHAAHPFREIGSEESDFHHDADGNRIPPEEAERMGLGRYAVADSDKIGHHKRFVRVNPEEYVKGRAVPDMLTGHTAKGAFHFNQNSRKRKFLSPTDPRYKEVYDNVFDQKRERWPKDDPRGNELYQDFLIGILQCIKFTGCGGAGSYEKTIMRQSVDAIHQIIVQEAMKTIDLPELQKRSSRISWAKDRTSHWAQQNLGAGTRRTRIFDPSLRNVSRDTAVAGKNGTISGSDSLDAQRKNRDDTGPNRNYSKIGRGGRTLTTGDQQFPYSIDSMRASLNNMRAEAQKADALKKMAVVQATDIARLNASVMAGAEVTDTIKNFLLALYAKNGTKNAEEIVNAQLQSWTEDGALSSQALVAQFQQHPLVVQALKGDVSQAPDEENSSEIEDAMKKFRTDLETLRQRQGDAAVKPMFMAKAPGHSRYVQGVVAPNFAAVRETSPSEYQKLLDTIQDKINKEIEGAATAKQAAPAAAAARDIQQPQPAAPAATQRTPFATPTGKWSDLVAQGDILKLAHHPTFAQEGTHKSFRNVIKWFDKHKQVIPPEHYASGRQKMLDAWKAKTGQDYNNE